MKTSPLGALDWLIMSESPGSFNSRYSLTSQSKARRVLRKVSESFSFSFLSFPWAADCFKFTLPRRFRDCANLASTFPLRHSRKWLKAKCTAVPSSGIWFSWSFDNFPLFKTMKGQIQTLFKKRPPQGKRNSVFPCRLFQSINESIETATERSSLWQWFWTNPGHAF